MESKLFQKAESGQAKLKLGIYGGAGSGKTYTALIIAKSLGSGKTACIDTEHGTDFYANRFDFDVLHTRATSEIQSAITLLETASNYDTLILDSITHIWEGVQTAYLEKLKNHPDPKKRRDELYFQDWRHIKKPYKDLMLRLLSLDMHVIICGRLAIEYEMKQGELTKTGERMKAESETPHEPHLLMKMEIVKNEKKIVHRGIIEKDRSGLLQDKIFDNPTSKDFGPLFEMLTAKQQVPLSTESETTSKDSTLFEEENGKLGESELISKTDARQLYSLGKKHKYTDGEMKAWLLTNYGVDSFFKVAVEHKDQIAEEFENEKLPRAKAEKTA